MKTILYIIIAIIVLWAIWYFGFRNKATVSSNLGTLGNPPKADGTCNIPLIVTNGICSNIVATSSPEGGMIGGTM